MNLPAALSHVVHLAQAATQAVAINGADTAWLMASTALVLLMTAALGFFYGGLVRGKNMLNTLMMSFASLGVVGVLWATRWRSRRGTPSSAGCGTRG